MPRVQEGPGYVGFFEQERRKAVEKKEQALKEKRACEEERNEMMRCALEVWHWHDALTEWRAQLNYKKEKAEAALRIIDEKTAEVLAAVNEEEEGRISPEDPLTEKKSS